ncbi:phenylacetic acid degradation bifunctional protein PaaZ [Actinopolyspora saharensis]|uniref:Oxepin-CoA hydrolase / 3-oxo-5,6-dehydrosuberyl-CoA semialdehyde dehydrogenase n=1 Tax=Actinopolyspora saharensis TaxID=995062 RepID=A0A1H1G983_9ACTN|nr:phenylacetic acid degradation bifunctional protein PaaZ [Actinopolyspora saharensis]SDR09478.1 oxepin-CoA hydrolase / 3-oxo-5,6-dehydrosuberyl-CoA semialdehyde dehydrogenase [Actinopolyspora saharensis]
MEPLRSYTAGRWRSPADEGTALYDAVTGGELARLSTAGIDRAAALAHGREVGGPALRELTFHQRAALLKSLASHLREHRQELYDLSASTGATRGDSKFDVDGGIGVLFSYSSKGRRELPNSTVHVDGGTEPLGKQGTFLGQHIATPLRGVAVQINAFNFPVWGPLEKLAPAFVAGVPTLIKPAEQTAHLTHRLVELIVESGILPEGSVQLLCGNAGDLLDHLTEQDLLSFTGSAATAQRIRAQDNVVRQSVRFNAEADSLNCSVLGPDATRDTAEFDLFVRQLVTEMTVKAGQKCTAVRRAFVPEGRVDEVVGAVADRLSGVAVGDPRNPEVDMGALADLEQREEVRRGLKGLLEAGRLVHGDPWQPFEPVGADYEQGAFVPPMLLRCDEPEQPQPHEIEVFGPVATVLPYRDAEHAVELANRGGGSLVGSVVSGDTEFVREVVLGAASRHGRMLVLNGSDAEESTGHGSPLPQLVHGGPGRAGGGEEMAGIRGVLHHMQRTAVQADPDTLTELTGQWFPGSTRTTTDAHPFRKHLEQLRVGDSVVGGPRGITAEDVRHFADFTGDEFYAHTDEAAAAANPFFGGLVAHGYLVVSLAAGLFVSPEPGPVLANYGLENLRFLTPTYPGDEITVTLTAKRITPRHNADYGEVRWDADVTNQHGESVAKYDVLTLVAKEGATSE